MNKKKKMTAKQIRMLKRKMKTKYLKSKIKRMQWEEKNKRKSIEKLVYPMMKKMRMMRVMKIKSEKKNQGRSH